MIPQHHDVRHMSRQFRNFRDMPVDVNYIINVQTLTLSKS